MINVDYYDVWVLADGTAKIVIHRKKWQEQMCDPDKAIDALVAPAPECESD